MNTHTKHNILMLGVVLMLSVFAFAPKSADAALWYCSDLDDDYGPLMSITVGGTTCANTRANPDAICNISVVSGTSLTASYYNETAIPNAPYSLIMHSWPNNRTASYTSGGTRAHTTDAIISSSQSFSMGADRDCEEINPDGTFYGPEHGGSVYVGITVVPTLSVQNCSGAPNPATTGSSMTWSVPTPTGGTGSYTYSWSGTDSLSGSTRTVNKTYSTTGTKNASVTVTSGTQSVTKNCSITVNAPVTNYTLTVTKAGTASTVGSVSSSPAGISCGSDCSESYSNGTSVTLTASPNGSTFAGWSGACTGTGSCVVSMTQARSVTATFNTTPPTTYTLTVTKAGTGSGTVGNTSPLPIGSHINCGTDCTHTYTSATVVTLGANPAAGSTFAGWSGACTGTGSCSVTMSASRNVTATFNTIGTLSVDLLVNGASSATVPYGQPATLTWTSGGATGGCRGSANPDDAAWPDQSTWVRATSGTQQVLTSAPYVSRTYTIQCTNGRSIVEDNVTVTVTGSGLSCSAESPQIYSGASATFNASGGSGTYSWTGGQTPPSGSGTSFVTQYTTTGTKTVTVDDGATTANCSVEVIAPGSNVCTVNVGNICGQIRVSSNIDTTWEITGPENISQTIDAGTTPVVYNMATCGTYSIVSIPDRGGMPPEVTPPGDATWGFGDLTQGGVLEFNINYNVPGVDLKVNGADDPKPVVSGEYVLLSWGSYGMAKDSCVASSKPNASVWFGSGKPVSNEGELSNSGVPEETTFTITCSNEKGVEYSDSVTIGIRPPECSDGEDNDGDDKIDCPGDPGCYPSGGDTCDPTDDDERNAPQCSDGIDNDDQEDEDIDADDIGCLSGPNGTYDPNDPNEENASTIVTDCNDGLNNDGDTNEKGVEMVDHESVTPTGYVPDPGCTSVLDPSEVEDPDIREI